MYKIGSPEWFHNVSISNSMIEYENKSEELRIKFYNKFCPQKLSEMDPIEVLINVFDNNKDSMMNILMQNSDYVLFGSSSKYPYMSILYRKSNGGWAYFDQNKHHVISQEEAKKKAVYLRDKIVACSNIIESSCLETPAQYKELELKLAKEFSKYHYVTILKYFHMIYPHYFPAFYSSEIIRRCLYILGLSSKPVLLNNRVYNMGLLALFTRACNINSNVFKNIYEKTWGWGDDLFYCESAKENKSVLNQSIASGEGLYKNLANRNFTDEEAQTIINEGNEFCDVIESIKIVGKEKEALVKVRVNQGKFREGLLARYKTCQLCGVSEKHLLIASHIKPWSESLNEEKCDCNNGFIFCPNHDKLFDEGYISFDDSGEILISDKLSEADRIFMNINDKMCLKTHLTGKTKEYLAFHRKKYGF